MVTKALAKVEKQPFGLVKVPEYLRGQGQKGLEEVGRDDMILPRLAIAQSGSPAFKKASRDRIEGLEEGDLYNTLTRVIYGDKSKKYIHQQHYQYHQQHLDHMFDDIYL